MKNRLSGTFLSEIPFSNMPIILKNIGFDFLIIDNEHGAFDYVDISKIIMISKLVGIEVIIRLADASRKDILKFMDMGAQGLLLPMTNNQKDIMEVIRHAKYPPQGQRGISTMRAHSMYNLIDINNYMKNANQDTKIYAQIETIDGLNNIHEILSVDGVDGFFLGPNDLSAEFNCLDNDNANQILEAIDQLKIVSSNLNKTAGIITTNPNYLNRAKINQYQMISVGSELSMLKKASKDIYNLIMEN